jgi:diaminohydroxyphosphoribosylaminopyrimidine deaminase/5-amino-6-(5-phosphoribosylamino)uracil reductase
MMDAREDAKWMRRALRLAERGFTPPNPMVGCVIVKDEVVVGEGWHPVAGQPHAEVFALRDAGEKAQGATAYVTLEPCSHWGRTPPCAEALIRAGVARVVAAAQDSDPRVGGTGLERLRAAGIAVSVGVLEAEARRLNAAFFHFHETGTPFVTLKAAMTLDGKIATRAGDSKWITGPAARRYVHRLRAQSGAVMVGIGTLLADDPQLTARLPGIELPRQPLRIVVDSQLRTPPNAQAVRLASEAPGAQPLLIAATKGAPPDRERALRREGVEILRLPAAPNGRVDLTALCLHLAQREVISVLAEGGGELHAALLCAQMAHRALFFIAPKIVGGRSAPTPVEGEGLAAVSQAVALDALRVRRFGPDLAIEGRIEHEG